MTQCTMIRRFTTELHLALTKPTDIRTYVHRDIHTYVRTDIRTYVRTYVSFRTDLNSELRLSYKHFCFTLTWSSIKFPVSSLAMTLDRNEVVI